MIVVVFTDTLFFNSVEKMDILKCRIDLVEGKHMLQNALFVFFQSWVHTIFPRHLVINEWIKYHATSTPPPPPPESPGFFLDKH